jgi:hypothetical protein
MRLRGQKVRPLTRVAAACLRLCWRFISYLSVAPALACPTAVLNFAGATDGRDEDELRPLP